MIRPEHLSVATPIAFALALFACSGGAPENVGEESSAAKLPGGRVDCFEKCEQKEYETLTKDGVAAACAALKKEWKDPNPKSTPPWPGWDDKKPICIGHKATITDLTHCNRLVEAPGYTYCKNQLMLVCVKEKQPGFGPIELHPPGKKFPPPMDPKSVTDSELRCIELWKCPYKTVKTASVSTERGIAPAAVASAQAEACTDGSCQVCDDSWFKVVPPEEPASTEPSPTEIQEQVLAPAFDIRDAR